MMATADRLIDPEDERLTASERHQLRQIALRLSTVDSSHIDKGLFTREQDAVHSRTQQTDLEEEIARLFAAPKTNGM
jgi:hypothetical protein